MCQKPLEVGQFLSVLSYPVECVGNNGDYSYVHDFLDNEIIVHFDCYKKVAPDIKNIAPQNNNRSKNAEMVLKLKDVLNNIGENIGINELNIFVRQHGDIQSVDDLIKEWFRSKACIQ